MTTENDNILIHLTAYTELKNYLQTKAKDYTVIKTCIEGVKMMQLTWRAIILSTRDLINFQRFINYFFIQTAKFNKKLLPLNKKWYTEFSFYKSPNCPVQ